MSVVGSVATDFRPGKNRRGKSLINTTGQLVTRNQGEPVAIRNEEALRQSLENACLIANVCDSYRGRETVVLDVTHASPLFDFFVITTGNSRRQLRAIAESADDAMERRKSDRLGREGQDQPWICHDYGDVVLHVFTEDGRSTYDLENLWGDATKVDYPTMLEKMGVSPAGKRQGAAPTT
ncbi:MAG: ribosome silencing factor [Planctomycetaceae bacterium]|nr:ribosome silencing factor [Planctomycetaceae bacterium]